MKMIDVLAFAMKEWPESTSVFIFGDETCTREQWQEAVNARDLAKAEWSGEGLPPVGTVCEFRIPEEFDGVSPWRPELRQGNRVEIIYRYDTGVSEVAVFKFDVAVGFLVEQASAGCFRPIRTPEQIAADEREKSILDMARSMMTGLVAAGDQEFKRAEKLYDAGYRKQEQK